uniref:peptidylprolyl isomerase n=1 Tax=Amphiprion ocellaris TaxID=80972 RepID=A0AAQ5YMR8_AMPOC
MIKWVQGVLCLSVLVAFAACNAPPVPLDDILIEKTFEPEQCVRSVKVGDFVRYHYIGMFPDGKKFDSSYDRGSTYNVFVGKKQLIEGMDKALVGMCINERRLVKIPPQLAYGKQGYGDIIPPDSILHFDVLLLDVWNPEDGVQINTYHTPSVCSRKVEVSDYVRYHYNGTLLLDGTFFDSSYSRNRTYDTYVGRGYVIAGMDEGLIGVCVGERRTITIPPHLAYGEEGTGSKIPGSAVLVFDVHIIDFHNPSDNTAVVVTFKPEECEKQTKKGDFVKYHYNASLMDGSSIDSTYNYGKTYNIVLGANQVVPGMEDGLMDMCVGEKRHLVIPPHLGYGERGVTDEVPGSAVLVFDVELVELEEGLPEGYMFIWNDEVSPDLFAEMDKNQDKQVEASEFTDYIIQQVNDGKGRLAPGFDPYRIIDNMFSNQDRNGDGKITEAEFKLKADEAAAHDEL